MVATKHTPLWSVVPPIVSARNQTNLTLFSFKARKSERGQNSTSETWRYVKGAMTQTQILIIYVVLWCYSKLLQHVQRLHINVLGTFTANTWLDCELLHCTRRYGCLWSIINNLDKVIGHLKLHAFSHNLVPSQLL